MRTRKEIDRIEEIWNNWNRDLTEEEQDYLDNFGRIFAEALICDFNPDSCKQIINHLSKIVNRCDFLDEYVKVVRCGWCKWWKDNRCTNVDGAYGNTILNSNWFCSSGKSVVEDD